MKFRNYLHTTMLCEELVETVSEEQVELFAESVTLIEAELNELLGLNRLGDKLKTLSSKGDKAVEDAKYVAKNIAKDTVGKVVDDAKEVYQSHKEIAQAAGKAIAGAFSKSQDAIKEIWGKATGNLSPEQTETIKSLESIFKKMSSGKFLSALESIKVLAAVLAGGTSKQIPSFKAYSKQLERLQTIPGLSSIRLSIKTA
jgi:uncharacterized protein YjbJ (UPF0337 family)